jgi:LETM1 and EF-hand domain-containing protein 1
LDRIGHSELQAVAQFFGVNKYGPRSYLKYQLERKLRKLHEDDKLIAAEGIEKLSKEELVHACFLRGLRVSSCLLCFLKQTKISNFLK